MVSLHRFLIPSLGSVCGESNAAHLKWTWGRESSDVISDGPDPGATSRSCPAFNSERRMHPSAPSDPDPCGRTYQDGYEHFDIHAQVDYFVEARRESNSNCPSTLYRWEHLNGL